MTIIEFLDTNTVFRAVGVLGFLLYMIGFAALQFELMDGNNIGYCIINIVAASCVLVSLTVDFNLASALIQCSWILIGSIGLALRRRKSRAENMRPA